MLNIFANIFNKFLIKIKQNYFVFLLILLLSGLSFTDEKILKEKQEFFLNRMKKYLLKDPNLSVFPLSKEIMKQYDPKIFQKEKLLRKKIALDPGHFGGEYAYLEERYVELIWKGKKIQLKEGDLTLLTALYLKKLLEEKGMEVFLTRTEVGKGAIKKDFLQWLKENPFFEKNAEAFRKYNIEDLKKRAELINQFEPDITLILHYNVQADVKISDKNYCMAFVPGSFCKKELQKKEEQKDFMRLLLSDQIEKSIELSQLILNHIENDLGVKKVSTKNNLPYLNRFSLQAEKGVYCRNLALTRRVKSPLCYLEPLIQNNKEEILRLVENEESFGEHKLPKRVKEVAHCCYLGILEYYHSK